MAYGGEIIIIIRIFNKNSLLTAMMITTTITGRNGRPQIYKMEVV
jgi:hypothetical protein